MTGSDYDRLWLWLPPRMTVDQWLLHILYSSECDYTDCSLALGWILMACALLSAINLQTPPRFASLSHQRAVKNEVRVMKNRMRCICSVSFFLLLLYAARPACEHRKMTSGISPRHAFRCDDATGCVWDAVEPADQWQCYQWVLFSHLCSSS